MVVVTHHVMVEAGLHMVAAGEEVAAALDRLEAAGSRSGRAQRPDSGRNGNRMMRHQGIRVTQKRRTSYSRRAVWSAGGECSPAGRESETGERQMPRRTM
jgi:hypothetical protein